MGDRDETDHASRLRLRLLKSSADAVAGYEILEMLLFAAQPGIT